MVKSPLADIRIVDAGDGRIFDARALVEDDGDSTPAPEIIPHEAVHVVQEAGAIDDAIAAASDEVIEADGSENGHDDDGRLGRQSVQAQAAAQTAAQAVASTTTDPDATGREATLAPAQKRPDEVDTQPDPTPEPVATTEDTPDAPVNPYLTRDDPADDDTTGSE